MGCGASKVVENERRPSGLHPCGDSSAASPTGRQEKLCPEAASQAILVANGSLQSPVVEEPAGAFNESTVMQRVKTVLQELSGIADNGSRASLGEAAAVMLKHFSTAGADTIILTACTAGSSVCILAGVAGEGAALMQQQLLTTDRNLSGAVCNLQSAPFLYQNVTSAEAAEDLPPDWAALHKEHGLKTFLAMRVSSHSDRTVGVVTLAARRVSAFQELWWDQLLSTVSSGLVRLLRHPLMAGLCEIAAELDCLDAQDYKVYSVTLLQRSAALLETLTGIRLVVRLGLLSKDGQALIVQHVPGGRSPDLESASQSGVSPSLQQVCLVARDTLFNDTIKSKGPRLVSDTSIYRETVGGRPSPDIFLGCEEEEASLVVVPLQLGPDTPYRAGLYLISDQKGNFATAKRPIVNLTSMLQLVVQKQLQEGGLLTKVWEDESIQKKGQQSSSGQLARTLAAFTTHSAPSTAACVMQMQEHVRKIAEQGKCVQVDCGAYVSDLHLESVLGKGGFGIVYRGTWRGGPAAVKVMAVPKQQRRVMKNAMEMAVQESLSHPNIVRVYSCLTDMVEEAEPVDRDGFREGGQRAHDPLLMRFRPASLEDVESGAICNVMIMEYCDRGTLSAAVQRGLLHFTSPEGRLSVSMWKLLMLLLDIARSLEHIHGLGLMHCDLKPANVLLKASPESPLGIKAKLADFGLVKMLYNDRMYIRNKSISGTITHLAPERFLIGSKLTSAVDIFAYGMLLFEMYTRRPPFQQLHAAAIIQQVARGNRPEFPKGTPDEYKQLAEACWAADPEQRPTATQICCRLEELVARTDGPTVLTFQQAFPVQ